MKIGFTGTQKGTTGAQLLSFVKLLGGIGGLVEFHHGDCIGADEEVASIMKYWISQPIIHCWPPLNESKRAFTDFDVEHLAAEYLVRNKSIVDATDALIATPGEKDEQLRSGTWSTVRYAVKIGKPVYIIYPDGSIEER